MGFEVEGFEEGQGFLEVLRLRARISWLGDSRLGMATEGEKVPGLSVWFA